MGRTERGTRFLRKIKNFHLAMLVLRYLESQVGNSDCFRLVSSTGIHPVWQSFFIPCLS